jgi:isocitrate lyase
MLRTVSRSVARQSRSLRTSSRTSQLLRPLSTTAYRMSSSALKAVDPPVSAALPGDSFQLLPEASKAGQAEDALFDEQVQAVRDWWASPRYKGIKRPYSAEDVVSKRGSLQQSYPSSLMARKLFNLLEEKAAEGEPVHTSAYVRDPVAGHVRPYSLPRMRSLPTLETTHTTPYQTRCNACSRHNSFTTARTGTTGGR